MATITPTDQDFEKLTRNVSGTLAVIDPDKLTKDVWAGSAEDLLKALTQGDTSWDEVSKAVDKAVVYLRVSGEDVSHVVKEIGRVRYWCVFHRGAEQCKKALTKKNGTVMLPLIGNLWARLPENYVDRVGSRFFEISADGAWEGVWSEDDPNRIDEGKAVVTELSYITDGASPGGVVFAYDASAPVESSDVQNIMVSVSARPKIADKSNLRSDIVLDKIGVSKVYISSITMPQTLIFPTLSTVPPDALPYAPVSQRIDPYSYGYVYLPYEEDRAWPWVAWYRTADVAENAKGKGILGLDVALEYQIEVACTDRDAIISEDVRGFASIDEFCISDGGVQALSAEYGCFKIPSEGNNERLMITFSCAAREPFDPDGEVRNGVVIDNMAGVTMYIGLSYKVPATPSYNETWHFPICDTKVGSEGLHPTGVSGMASYYVVRLDKDTRWWSFSYWRRRLLCKDENGEKLETVTPEYDLAHGLMLAWYGDEKGSALLTYFVGALSGGMHPSAVTLGTNYSGPTRPGGFGEIFFLDNLDDQFKDRHAVVTGLAVSFHDKTGSAFRCGTREYRGDRQADLLVFGATSPDGYIYKNDFRESGMAEGGMIDVGATALLESCYNLWTKTDASTFLADAGIRIFPVLAPGTPVVVRAKYGGTVNTSCPLRAPSNYLSTYSDSVHAPKGLSAVISTPWLAGGVALRRMYQGNISIYTFDEHYFTSNESGYSTVGPPSSGGQLQIFTNYEEAKWVITGLVGEGGSDVGATVLYRNGTWSATKIGTISTAVSGGYNSASGEAGTPGALGCWHLVYGHDAETLSFITRWDGGVKYTVDYKDRDGGTVTTTTLEREDGTNVTTMTDPRAFTTSIGGDHATGATIKFWSGKPRYFATTGFETPGKMATVTVTMTGEDALSKFEGWFWKSGSFGANDGSDIHTENYPEGCFGWVDKYGKEFTFNLPPLGITYGNDMIGETDEISLGQIMLRPGADPDEWMKEPEDWSDLNDSWNDSWNDVVWGDVTDEELTMEPIGPDITDDMWMVFETPTRARTMSLRASTPAQDLTTKPVVVDQYGHVVWADGEKMYGSKKNTVLKVTVTCEEKDRHSGMDCMITTDNRDVVINLDEGLKVRVPMITTTYGSTVGDLDIKNLSWDLDGDEKTFVFRLVTKFDSNGSDAALVGWNDRLAGAKITNKASGVTANLMYSTDSLISIEGAIATLTITIKSGAVAEGTELVSVKVTPPTATVSPAVAGQNTFEAEPITLSFRVRGDVIVDPPGGGGEVVDNTVSREASVSWGQRKLNGPPDEKSLYVLVRDGTVVDSKWLVTVVAGCFTNSTSGLGYRASGHRVKVVVENMTTGRRIEESVGLGWFKRTYSIEDIQ